MQTERVLAVAISAVLLGSGASIAMAEGAFGARGAPSTTPTTRGILKRPERIVQLGDSIASGEGILYGYTYNAKNKEWTGGDIDVQWPKPYPDCHVSGDGYGHHVAATLHATFWQFACTGASFADGIVGPALSSKKVRRPPEFGNWPTKQQLNEEYDDAHPDLVLVTLGADDAKFSDVVENCIKNAYNHFATRECVPSNPGSTIQKDFFDFIPTLRQNYAALISWINERATYKAVGGRLPKIVFTTYANPFPDKGVSCNDVNYLYDDQIAYLSSLVDQMNATILQSIPTLGSDNIALADLSNVYRSNGDHRWCTEDPWVYGLSIYSFYHPSSFSSLAPFHPTARGQQAIARVVTQTVLSLFNRQAPPVPASTSTTTAPTSSTTSTSTPESTSTSTTSPP